MNQNRLIDFENDISKARMCSRMLTISHHFAQELVDEIRSLKAAIDRKDANQGANLRLDSSQGK